MARRTGIVVLAVIGAALLVALAASLVRQQAAPPATGETVPDKTWQAVAPGRVEPKSGETRITPVAAGVVAEVLVKVNDKVFPAEPLIRLNDDELRARLAAAEAQVKIRLRARNDERASGKAADRRRAEDALNDAEHEVVDARAALDTAAAARRAGRGSEADLTNARRALSVAEDLVKARTSALRSAEDDAPLPREADAQLSIARAERAVARVALDKMTIRAPIAGTVLQINIKPGETAIPSATQPLLVIGDVSALRVRAELDDRDLGMIKVGQSVVVRMPAFPGRDMSGKVASIAPIVGPASRAARGTRNPTDVDIVEVMIDLTDVGPLASGMQVDVYFRRNEP
jgi:HlyD family secretion protein